MASVTEQEISDLKAENRELRFALHGATIQGQSAHQMIITMHKGFTAMAHALNQMHGMKCVQEIDRSRYEMAARKVEHDGSSGLRDSKPLLPLPLHKELVGRELGEDAPIKNLITSYTDYFFRTAPVPK